MRFYCFPPEEQAYCGVLTPLRFCPFSFRFQLGENCYFFKKRLVLKK